MPNSASISSSLSFSTRWTLEQHDHPIFLFESFVLNFFAFEGTNFIPKLWENCKKGKVLRDLAENRKNLLNI